MQVGTIFEPHSHGDLPRRSQDKNKMTKGFGLYPEVKKKSSQKTRI